MNTVRNFRSIEELRGCELGKDVFILGAGPSLHRFDMSLIQGRPVVCVNSSILKYQSPSYYFTCDGLERFKHHWKYVEEGTFPLVIGDGYRRSKKIIRKDRVFLFSRTETFNLDPNAKTLVASPSSSHSAVHFALILGAKRVIVIGCDCESKEGKNWFFQYEEEEKDCYVDSNFKAPAMDMASFCNSWFRYWEKLRNQNLETNIQVWGGRLEKVFPRYEGD